jgi:hypothetical protein
MIIYVYYYYNFLSLTIYYKSKPNMPDIGQSSLVLLLASDKRRHLPDVAPIIGSDIGPRLTQDWPVAWGCSQQLYLT